MKTKLIRFWRWMVIVYAKYCTDYRYIANKGTKEVHDLWHEHTNCHLTWLTKVDFIKESELESWFKKGYNGCKFCMKKEDRG